MAAKVPHKIPVVFYRTRGGAELVRDWLRSLDERDRNAIGLDLMRIQFRWPVGMPLCRSAVLWAKGCGRSARAFRAAESHGYCFASWRNASLYCTASSRRHRRHPTMSWPLLANE